MKFLIMKTIIKSLTYVLVFIILYSCAPRLAKKQMYTYKRGVMEFNTNRDSNSCILHVKYLILGYSTYILLDSIYFKNTNLLGKYTNGEKNKVEWDTYADTLIMPKLDGNPPISYFFVHKESERCTLEFINKSDSLGHFSIDFSARKDFPLYILFADSIKLKYSYNPVLVIDKK